MTEDIDFDIYHFNVLLTNGSRRYKYLQRAHMFPGLFIKILGRIVTKDKHGHCAYLKNFSQNDSRVKQLMEGKTRTSLDWH